MHCSSERLYWSIVMLWLQCWHQDANMLIMTNANRLIFSRYNSVHPMGILIVCTRVHDNPSKCCFCKISYKKQKCTPAGGRRGKVAFLYIHSKTWVYVQKCANPSNRCWFDRSMLIDISFWTKVVDWMTDQHFHQANISIKCWGTVSTCQLKLCLKT